jgi:hypothetical protein
MSDFQIGNWVYFNLKSDITYEIHGGEGEIINILTNDTKYPYEVRFDRSGGVFTSLCFSAKELQHIGDDTKLEDFL